MNSATRVACLLLALALVSTTQLPIAEAENPDLVLVGDIMVTGGPWFIGDIFELSALVHNNASFESTASLSLNVSGSLTQGTSHQLQSGSSAELRVEHTLLAEGEIEFEWLVLDGESEVFFNGTGTVEVQPSQTLEVEVISTDYNPDSGFTVIWSSTLSPGKNRQVSAQISFESGTESSENTALDVILEPGQRTFSHTVGHAPVGMQSIGVELLPDSWIALGNTSDAIEISSVPSGLKVEVAAGTPTSPAFGDEISISLSLRNTGPLDVGEGVLRAADGQKRLLAEEVTGGLASGESRDVTIKIAEWRSSSTTTLEIKWYVAGQFHSDSLEIISTNSASKTEGGGVEIAWTGVLAGIFIALALIMSLRVATIWRSKNSEPSRTYSIRSKPVGPTKPQETEEKRDIACPSCERQLRVPVSYSGQVKCPSCRIQFSTSGKADADIPTTVPETPPVNELSASSADDIVQCPECTQSLRVPYQKRPAKARCPNCSTIFNALAN